MKLEAAPMWRPSPIALAQIITGTDLAAGALGADDHSVRVRTLLNRVFAEGGLQELFVPRPGSQGSIIDALIDAKLQSQSFATAPQAYEGLRSCLRGAWLANVERLWKEFQPGCEIMLGTQLTIAGTGFEEPDVPVSIGHYRSLEQPVVRAGARALEPIQGPWRDCWLVASMAAVAWHDEPSLSASLSALPLQWSNPPSVTWRRPSDGAQMQLEYSFPRASNGARICTYSISGNETWPSLIEKAFAAETQPAPNVQAGGANPVLSQYQGLMFGRPQEALTRLTTWQYQRRALNVFRYLKAVCNPNQPPAYPVVATTCDPQPPNNDYFVMPNHAYAVLGLIQQPTALYVVLREPYGAPQIGQRIDFPVAQLDGRPDVDVGQNGVIAIPKSEFELRFDAVSVPDQVAPVP